MSLRWAAIQAVLEIEGIKHALNRKLYIGKIVSDNGRPYCKGCITDTMYEKYNMTKCNRGDEGNLRWVSRERNRIVTPLA